MRTTTKRRKYDEMLFQATLETILNQQPDERDDLPCLSEFDGFKCELRAGHTHHHSTHTSPEYRDKYPDVLGWADA